MQFLSKLIQREFSHYIFSKHSILRKYKNKRQWNEPFKEYPWCRNLVQQFTNEMENWLCLLRINIMLAKELLVFYTGQHAQEP